MNTSFPRTASMMNPLIPVELVSRMKALGLYPHYPGLFATVRHRKRPTKSPRRGRPSIFSEEVADTIFEIILTDGFKDARAARLVGISASTVSRWKRKIPEFAEFLALARAK